MLVPDRKTLDEHEEETRATSANPGSIGRAPSNAEPAPGGGAMRYEAVGGVSEAALTISSITLLKSSRPGAGMMIVSRRPPTSSVIRRNRPRGFSFSARRKVFLSIWIFSERSVSSFDGGLGELC